MQPPKQITIVEASSTLEKQIPALLFDFLIKSHQNSKHPEFRVKQRTDLEIIDHQKELQGGSYIIKITWLPKNQYYAARISASGSPEEWAVFHNDAQVLDTQKDTKEKAQLLAHNYNHRPQRKM